MLSHLPRPIKMIRRSLHIKLLLSSLLVIALSMGFAVYALYIGHIEEQTQKASARMQENL
ncbi:MAG: ATP-binding protein, partial [Aeromonas sobria]